MNEKPGGALTGCPQGVTRHSGYIKNAPFEAQVKPQPEFDAGNFRFHYFGPGFVGAFF